MQLGIALVSFAWFVWILPISIIDLTTLTQHVPEPYMDEIFHVGQTQQYCQSNWSHWDPKITTPPGSYIAPVALSHTLSHTLSYITSIWDDPNTFPQLHNISKLLYQGLLLQNNAVTPLLEAEPPLCSTLFIRTVNTVVSWVLFFGIWLLLRDLTYNPLYPILNSLLYIQQTLNTTTRYFLSECLIVLQSLILWHIPFSSFFYSMVYTDTSSTLSLVLVALLSRRLVPFYSCERRIMNEKFSFIRYISVLLLSIFSVMVRQTNIIWIGMISAMTILQYVYHQAYYGYITPILYPTKFPFKSTTPQSSLDTCSHSKQSKRNDSKSQIGQNEEDLSPQRIGIQPLPPPPLLPSTFHLIKTSIKALLNHNILFALSPHILTLLLFVVFIKLNGGVVLGDKTNHIAVMNFSQIPLFLASTLLLLPFFTKISIISGFPFLQVPHEHEEENAKNVKQADFADFKVDVQLYEYNKFHQLQQQQKSENAPPRSKCRLFWMIFGHIIGLVGLGYCFWIALGHIYPHPFLLADNRHYAFYLYRILTNPFTKYLPSSIQSQLSPELLDVLTNSYIINIFTTSTSAQLFITPIAIIMLYFLQATNLIATMIWFIFSSFALVPTGLIEPRYYIPLLIFAVVYIQHQGENLIIKIATRFDQFSIRVYCFMALFGLMIFCRLVLTKIFIFNPFTWVDGTIARFMF